MGAVTDLLRQLLETHIERYGVVVWYDPQDNYSDFVRALNWPMVKVHRYCGSFFKLRHEIEPYLAQEQIPHLLVYVDTARSTTGHALAEVEATGVVLEPDPNAAGRDTTLATICYAVISDVLSPQALDEILHNESLTLADLDRIAQGANPVSGTLSLIFESSVSPSDLALAFLANTDVDNALIAKSAQGELATLLVENFGLPEPRSQALSDLRTQFTRHVLLTDFRASLPGDIAYEILATVPFPRVRWQTEACQRLAARWRDSATHRAAYKAAACQVEHDYGIHALDLAWDAWQRVQTFSVVETLLLENAERLILSGAYAEALALVEQRRSSFWNANERENDLRWSLIHAAASLLADCPKIQEGLDKRPWSASEMIIAYAQGTYEAIRPWCLLDTFHRHMERLYTSLAPTPTLNHVVAKARQAYTTVMQQVAEHFGNALTKAQFQIPEVAQQTNIFREQVAPRLQHGKVAYIVMDALRFEMARELLNDLTEASQKILIPALAAVPTLTSVGMAALLPGAERGLGLIEVSGQLATDINGHLLKMRGDRVEYLTQRGGYETEVFTLAEALKLGRIVKEQINRAQLVVVTSQEIDHVAEQQAPYLARGAMDELLSHVKRALHNLAEIGVSTFIIASDHGFLFGDELASDILVDPPGGHTVKLTQRVWIGRGGTASPACLRVKASEVGMGGDLEFVFPKGLASFRMRGGATPYYHGGITLQELVIPVAIVQITP